MKKFIFALTTLFISTISFAQKDVTLFLGIPVDGTKADMIQKLKAKGFTYDATKDVLYGQFNGRNSNLYVAANNGKVYRIMVCDHDVISETDIRIRFNTLCRQFEQNKKYTPQNLLGGYEIEESEDISYEMTIHNKRYQAAYYQVSEEDFEKSIDSFDVEKYMEENKNQYSEEKLKKLDEKELGRTVVNLFDSMMKQFSHKSVWFMINEHYGKYYISIFYDNELNKANGEDL